MAGTAPRATLRLHIGTLSLPGGSPAAAERVGAALRAELGALLARPALAARLRSPAAPERLGAGALRLVPAERPEQTGRRLARLVAAALAGLGDGGDERGAP